MHLFQFHCTKRGFVCRPPDGNVEHDEKMPVGVLEEKCGKLGTDVTRFRLWL